ncbi:MAG: hypothetical protein SCJ93_13530 [Bacillota bacterium]|nr:hypothetical protein [Bacillota bacterium]
MGKGFPFYGQRIGVLVFNGTAPRIPGDPGDADTYDFGVRYGIVKGSFSDLINGSENIKVELVRVCKELENQGIKAIVGDCGLMGLYQNDIKNSIEIPVITSSIVLIPFIESIISDNKKIGIVTGHSELLKKDHLMGGGVKNFDRLVIKGMQNSKHFKKIVIDGGDKLNRDLMSIEVVDVVYEMIEDNKDIGAIVLECSNLGTYSRDIWTKFKIPVFDINTCTNFLFNSVFPQKY